MGALWVQEGDQQYREDEGKASSTTIAAGSTLATSLDPLIPHLTPDSVKDSLVSSFEQGEMNKGWKRERD